MSIRVGLAGRASQHNHRQACAEYRRRIGGMAGSRDRGETLFAIGQPVIRITIRPPSSTRIECLIRPVRGIEAPFWITGIDGLTKTDLGQSSCVDRYLSVTRSGTGKRQENSYWREGAAVLIPVAFRYCRYAVPGSTWSGSILRRPVRSKSESKLTI